MKNSSKKKAGKSKATQVQAGPAGSVALYLISPLDVSGTFPDRLARALDAGEVAAFQFRVKGLDDHAASELAEPLRQRNAVVDDERDAALGADALQRLGADGVHLGQGDGNVADAREQLGQEAQIGVTCHASRHLAMDAGEAGADYVAFGAFFPTTTKEVEHYADLETLTWWQSIFEIPCVAIGGITPQNCAPLVQAGADFLAISGAVWSGDEAANIRAFHEAISAAWNPVAAPSADSDVAG
jgi:thiamine-phosphate pyrophosphorylase